VIHRTFRSLDEAAKLVGFTLRQWAGLIAGASAVLGLVYLAHLPTKAAITLSVFLVGLPAALTYVSESGGLQLGALLRDLCCWRVSRQFLPAVPAGFSGARGVVILARPEQEPSGAHVSSRVEAADPALERLLSEERWER
jgi:hypothetical protein